MGPYIISTLETVRHLTEIFSKKAGQDVRFGFVGYRDHGDELKTFLVKARDLTTAENLISFLRLMTAAGGGGDSNEAVIDGLMACFDKITWRPESQRYIFHACDAPPHGREYGRRGDKYPNGCPCDRTLTDVADRMRLHKINYKLLKIGHHVNAMS